MSLQGLLFHDIFIPYKPEFVRAIGKYLENEEKNNGIMQCIRDLCEAIDSFQKNPKNTTIGGNLKNKLSDFQKNVLKLNNAELELLVLYKKDDGNKAVYSAIVKESDQIDNKMRIKTTGTLFKQAKEIQEEIKNKEKAQQVEKALQKHFEDLFNFMNGTILNSQAFKIYTFHFSTLANKTQFDHANLHTHLTSLSWREAFYGANPSWTGNLYDAFFNHLANYEKEIFAYLKSRGNVSIDERRLPNISFSKSVFEEEGGVEPQPQGHFAELLSESKNKISGLASGDILIISKNNGTVLYNIQLKTTVYSGEKTNFDISLQQFKTSLEEILDKENNYEQKAKLLFNALKTEVSNIKDFDKNAEDHLIEIVKERFKYKTGITVS